MNKNIVMMILVVLVVIFGYMAFKGGNSSQEAATIKSGVSDPTLVKSQVEQFAKQNNASVYFFNASESSRVKDAIVQVNPTTSTGNSYAEKYKYFCMTTQLWDPNAGMFYYYTNSNNGATWNTTGGATCYFVSVTG